MSTPREYTTEEIRSQFLDHVWRLIGHWDRSDNKDCRGRLEGLAFSILSAIDGSSADLPAFILAPCPHEDDKDFHADLGENWFPENDEDSVKGDIAGGLHEQFYKHNTHRKTQP